MNFDRTEDQELLASSIARFVERDYGFDARRRTVQSAEGYSEAIWRTLADLGLLGLTLPSAHGGFGGGATDAMSLMHAIGSALIVEPWLACVGMGAQLVARAGSDAQQRRILPAVCAGSLKVVLAHTDGEAPDYAAFVAVEARATDGGYALHGTKRAVPHGAAADLLIVSARTDGAGTQREGITLFLVDGHAAGLTLTRWRMLDGTRAADIEFDDVRVPKDAVLGAPGEALPVVEHVLDFATALVCAEAVGAIQSANDATLEYLKTRRQFGVPIGTFQALQHRMVDLAIEHEQALSMACLACSTVDHERDAARRARIVSAAKVRIADACRRVSQESVQLHGGMGMTDEMKISHTFRRLTAIARQFGDADRHLARFAALDDRAQQKL